MGVEILPAGLAHCAVLAGLHGYCFRAAWAEDEFARLLAMPGAFAMLAGRRGVMNSGMTNSYPIGFALARAAGGECEIITLGVLPVGRGRGVGRRLVAATAAEAAASGARELRLEVADNNIAALNLYRSNGFRSVGRYNSYYRNLNGGEVDAVVMHRTLALS
jgi:ribosomal-protein-alanine N-acetyltransferase